MIYVISKATFGEYEVRDIQCNANWCSCPYSDYALIPDSMVEDILATKGYCDITLNSDGTEVESFIAREIPSVPEECCGENTVLSVNGAKANSKGEIRLPQNLLDNSDFRNPVNQRGQTAYSSAGYNIDRWTAPVMGDISLSGYGMKLVGVENDYGTQNRQRVSSYETGKVYTFAVCDSNGTITIVSAIPSESWAKTVKPWGEIGIAVISGLLTANIKVAASYSKTFRWAVLYEGEYTAETLPEYKPKGYGVELAECMRYFQVFLTRVRYLIGNSTYTTCFPISFMVPMRIIPTVTMTHMVENVNGIEAISSLGATIHVVGQSGDGTLGAQFSADL